MAGLSIEDSTGDGGEPLFAFALAVDRVRAARRAIDASGSGVLLTGRSEGFIAGRPDLAETIRRLVAYADAGAECLYAPGIRTPEEIDAVVRAVAPRPVNVLAHTDFATVAELAALGVRRISVGGALARAAWGGLMAAAHGDRHCRHLQRVDSWAALGRVERRLPSSLTTSRPSAPAIGRQSSGAV